MTLAEESVLRERVKAGLEYLDRVHPDWPEKVPANFSMRCRNNCIVRHLSGDEYPFGVAHLEIRDPVGLGFYLQGDSNDPHVIENYAFLTREFGAARDERIRKLQELHYRAQEMSSQEQLELTCA